MKNVRVYLCDGTIDGIFTAIYEAWESKYGYQNIQIAESQENYQLFTDYIQVITDGEKAEKVAESIKRKISKGAYEMICRAALCKNQKKADAIYRFLLLGFGVGEQIVEQLAHPYVQPIFQMDRRVNNEVLHYLGFLRFKQLENTVLIARIRPENHIITLLSSHFADRLPEENWMIYDEGRKCATVHRGGGTWFYTDGEGINTEAFEKLSDKEKQMQLIWSHFVQAVGIKERYNDKLQFQMLPKRYREFMPEVL